MRNVTKFDDAQESNYMNLDNFHEFKILGNCNLIINYNQIAILHLNKVKFKSLIQTNINNIKLISS